MKTSPMHALPAGHKFRCRQCGADARPFFDHNGVGCHVTDAGLMCTYGPEGQFYGNHSIVTVPVDAPALGPCHCDYCGRAGCEGCRPAPDVHVMSDKSFADRRVIVVRVGDTMEVSRVVTFAGPTNGAGPVFIGSSLDLTRVDSPERFGDVFGPDWVREFFAR